LSGRSFREAFVKSVALIAAAACMLAAGCSFRSERVVETPAVAPTTQRTTTVYTEPVVTSPTTTTTVYTIPAR
jgi:hypothetical protein